MSLAARQKVGFLLAIGLPSRRVAPQRRGEWKRSMEIVRLGLKACSAERRRKRLLWSPRMGLS